jgi:hypothetical protein
VLGALLPASAASGIAPRVVDIANRGSLPPASVEAAAIALGRARAEIDWPGEPAQLRLTLALRGALHDHSPPHGADRDLEFVTPTSRLGLTDTPLT